MVEFMARHRIDEKKHNNISLSDYLLITFTATSPGHQRKLSSHWINPTLHLALKPDRNHHTHMITDGCIIYAAVYSEVTW